MEHRSAPLPSSGRRRFLGWLLGTSGAALLFSALYPVLRFISPPRVPEASTNQVEAGPVNDPELIQKGYKIIHFGNDPVILIRAAENQFVALSATCTHLDCIVEFQKNRERIYCNCHGGVYDLSGRNVSGPPPRPLTPYKVDVVAAQGGQPATIIVSRA